MGSLAAVFTSIMTTVSLAGAAIAVFTALRVLTTRVDGPVSDRLLALAIFVQGFCVIHPIGSHGLLPQPVITSEPMQFFIPLTLLWYLRSLAASRIFRVSDGIACGLASLFIVLSLIPDLQTPQAGLGYSWVTVLMWGCLVLETFALLAPAWHELAIRRNDLRKYHSSLTGRDPAWALALLVLFAVLFGIQLILMLLLLHAPQGFPSATVLSGLMAIAVVFFCWGALGRKPDAVVPETGSAQAMPADQANDPDCVELGQKIQQAVRERRLFTDPELGLDDLARLMGISRHDASAAINRGLGKSFFELVNGLRVEEFQRLCRDPALSGEKILTLAFDSGFNSKPAFNEIFKRQTGQTPSAWRQSTTTRV
jgi:AraC-like DNA-binding protein